MLKLFHIWQPLETEDARTAMVFEFLRHAPAEKGLSPWLSKVLGREATVSGLNVEDFWPQYQSIVDGHHWTEPELVFEASDENGPFLVIVEAKPGFGMHDPAQLVREAVDTASAEKPTRIAVIAVGLDIGLPLDVPKWNDAIRSGLDLHGLGEVESVLAYSPWAWLGNTIESCAKAEPALALYAEDVLFQMQLNNLLGYKGAPMLDDLEGLTLNNAVVAYNRAVVAARQFFITLHGQPAFASAGLVSWGGRSHEFRRDGISSKSLSESDDWFLTSTMMCLYRKPTWPEGIGTFVAFYFGDEDPEPAMHAGALYTATGSDIVSEFAWAEPADSASNEVLQKIGTEHCPHFAAADTLECSYDRRPWRPGDEDADVAWAADKLTAVTNALG